MTNVLNAEKRLRKVLRGRPYNVNEFARKYRLDEQEAKRLYEKFGPSATDLDLLMSAKCSASRKLPPWDL
ncbi:hypothetical protein C9413_08295 [Rhizobium sp. SEMIA 4085]|uniref:Uncharacterized protein n=1 Tax=Rhizobium gallicum bv. gallicum R602sp TaxID=1041138 RepID=A0A0B4X2Y8_9HYPH|nr:MULTISPECIES: hypothetical protein [Rhizobium]AJD42464.1 hypothetical protein RGR602_CH03147 [Rhizobium gallicum bv. gallicum R602sp]NNH29497.1 hypothetical protein [Rhizobium sp. SEMIA 4085]